MSDLESGQRTQPPTERRRREARQRGDVVKSSQLTSAIMLLVASLCFWLIAPTSTDSLSVAFKTRLAAPPMAAVSVNTASELLGSQLFLVLSIVLPLGILLMISGLAANLFQTGWLWIPSRLMPRLETMRKNRGWKLIEPTGFVLQLGVIGCLTWRFVVIRQWQLRSMSLIEPGRMLPEMISVVSQFSFQLAACLVLLGIVDYGYRFWRYEQSLKMTVEEVRREQREESIDPQVRDRHSRLNRRDAKSISSVSTAPIDAVRV